MLNMSVLKRKCWLNVTALIILLVTGTTRAELFGGFDSIVSTISRPHDTLEAESWWRIPQPEQPVASFSL